MATQSVVEKQVAQHTNRNIPLPVPVSEPVAVAADPARVSMVDVLKSHQESIAAIELHFSHLPTAFKRLVIAGLKESFTRKRKKK